jgi:hypothetical protein
LQVKYALTNPTVEGLSPGVVLATTALGSLRGIIVDVVWIRMEALKQEGKFFEIVQLSDLACRLAPNFSDVWDFSAWNMAYNVSVQIPDYVERWLWVKAGLDLLRDQGIPNNPTEPRLYFSLAWTYFHKVGEYLDDAHFFYKEKFGGDMHEVLGGSGSREELARFAGAPKTKEELLKNDIVRAFYERSLAAGFDPLREDPAEGNIDFFKWVRRPDSISEDARKILEDEQNKYALEKIADFARARRLEKLRLDPGKMIALVDKYGPLDWRGPYAHSIYWATEGMRVAEEYKAHVAERRKKWGIAAPTKAEWKIATPEGAYNEINYDRIVYWSLQYLVTRGRFMFNNKGQMLASLGPDYRFTKAMIDQFEMVIPKYEHSERFAEGTQDAYENFLRTVSTEFFYRGDRIKSEEYYGRLLAMTTKAEYKVPYDEYIIREAEAYVSSLNPDEARNLVSSLLTQCFFYLGCNEDERATAMDTYAKTVISKWNEKRDVEKVSQAIDFDKQRELALIDIFAGRAGFPPDVVEGLKKRLEPGLVKRLEVAAKETFRLLTPEEKRRDPMPEIYKEYNLPSPEK